MFRRLGITVQRTTDATEVENSERVLLPGVGHFDAGAGALAQSGMGEAVGVAARKGTPVLGICLGMQLLTTGSEEGALPGLGLLPARCVRFSESSGLRVPHMGWNWIAPSSHHPLVTGLLSPSKFYFAHSYHALSQDLSIVLAETSYGSRFPSIIGRDNVVGAQFHPEKSHRFGMTLLESFAGWAP
jgi:glutamine amidotransferase